MMLTNNFLYKKLATKKLILNFDATLTKFLFGFTKPYNIQTKKDHR